MAFAVALTCACTAQTENEDITIKDVDVVEFEALIEQGSGTILDVRTAEEFSEGSIDGAVNMDFYASDFAQQLEGLNKEQPVYVYCAAGGRSAKAMAQMEEMGFTEVYNLLGGYGAWSEAHE